MLDYQAIKFLISQTYPSRQISSVYGGYEFHGLCETEPWVMAKSPLEWIELAI